MFSRRPHLEGSLSCTIPGAVLGQQISKIFWLLWSHILRIGFVRTALWYPAGDLSAQAASCAASPALSRGGALKIPRLHLSPAPSATAMELRGVPASRPSPAPSGAAKVPPLRLSPAPSGGFLQESRAGSAVGQPSRSGSSGGEKRSERAEAIAALHGVAPFQAPGMPQKVPALHLPGRLKGECAYYGGTLSCMDKVLISHNDYQDNMFGLHAGGLDTETTTSILQ